MRISLKKTQPGRRPGCIFFFWNLPFGQVSFFFSETCLRRGCVFFGRFLSRFRFLSEVSFLMYSRIRMLNTKFLYEPNYLQFDDTSRARVVIYVKINFWLLLINNNELKTWLRQFVTTWYHSCFHTSSGPGGVSTQARKQANAVTDIYTNSS